MAYASGALLSVLSTAVVARHLGAGAYDGYATVISLALVAVLVADTGLATLGVREYLSTSGAARDRSLRALLTVRLGLMIVAAAGMGAFTALSGFSRDLVLGALVTGASLVIQVLPSTYLVPLQAELRLGLVSAQDFARQLVQAVLLVVLALLGAGVLPLLACAVPASLVAVAVVLPTARRVVPLRPSLDRRAVTGTLRLAVSFSLATGVGAIYSYVVQVVTHLTTTEEQSGLFALAFRVLAVLVAVAGLVMSSIFPVLSRATASGAERLSHVASRVYEAMALLGVLVGVGMSAGADAIVAILGGPRFVGAVPMVRLLGVALAGSFVVAAGAFVLLALRRHRTLLRVNLTALLVAVGLTAVLSSRFGGLGSAAALASTEWGLAAVFAVVLRRGGQQVTVRRRHRWSLAGGTAAAAALAALLDAVVPPLPSGLLGGVLCPAVVLLVAAASGTVPDAAHHAVLARVGRRLG